MKDGPLKRLGQLILADEFIRNFYFLYFPNSLQPDTHFCNKSEGRIKKSLDVLSL